ncbi:MAG: EAL domain-containing protein [Sphingomonadales bacterium]|nr:EAL domain-containing protein [Sphingomonadales bacterium]
MIEKLRRYWRAALHRDEVSGRVRSALIATLYQSPASLAVGALCGSYVAIYVAIKAADPLITVTAELLVAVAALRIITHIAFAKRVETEQVERSAWFEYIYEAGAWSFSLLLGLLAAATVYKHLDSALMLMAASTAIGYGAAIAARNAGRPIIAIGQTLLSTIPVTIALAWEGGVANTITAATFVLYMAAMVGITARTFAVVRDSYIYADAQVTLANEMKVYATTDAVTGLINRAGLNAYIESDDSVRFGNDAAALFWIDLDRFKEVNDTLGHPVGDHLLVTIAERLRELSGPNDIICRFGGDEFIIVCPAMEAERADLFAHSLLAAVAKPIWIDDGAINVTASIGIALTPDHADSAESLMKRADMALYQSKTGGRNQYSFYQADMTYALTRRREIESELRDAIGNGQLQVHYQPIVNFKSGRIAAFEALVRWHHPERGALSPEEFIPIAESTGLILTIGNWIVGEACRAASQWPAHIPVCVNVSPIQMRAPGAALGFLSALRNARIGGSKLELEVTETVFMDESPEIADFIATVEEHGIRLALDDFGTGYSSLAYLYKHEFSKIKIDRSFVTGQVHEHKAMSIVRAIAGLAHELGMRVVAEGVETADEQERVYDAGCTHGQGYLYSPAVPADQALRLLAAEKGEGSRVA